MADNNSIIKKFEEFIQKYKPKNCYIGITDDPFQRLVEHKVTKDNGDYTSKNCDGLYSNAETKNNAKIIEKTFVSKYKSKGIKGNTGGVNDDSKYVYVYKIVSEITDETA